jgi:hypothetical protein
MGHPNGWGPARGERQLQKQRQNVAGLAVVIPPIANCAMDGAPERLGTCQRRTATATATAECGPSCGCDPTHRKPRDGWGTRTVGDLPENGWGPARGERQLQKQRQNVAGLAVVIPPIANCAMDGAPERLGPYQRTVGDLPEENGWGPARGERTINGRLPEGEPTMTRQKCRAEVR